MALALSRELTALRREERRRLADAPATQAFGELAAAWFRRVAKRRVEPANERKHIEHLTALLGLREGSLTKATIDEALSGLLQPNGHLSPASVNKVRSTGRAVIRDAQANGLWGALNPFDLVPRLFEPRPTKHTLTGPELRRVLAKLPRRLRVMAIAAVLTMMRPGELFALQKVDVDLVAGTIHVHRSHERNKTKTGRERTLVIHRELIPILRRALASASTTYVFPAPRGGRYHRKNRLAKLLRTAIKRAGVGTGFRFRCRKLTCSYARELVRENRDELPCPKCKKPMWSVAIPKRLRWYDLRHTGSTLLRNAKCDPMVIDEMLGHVLRVTEGSYIDLGNDDRRREIHRLSLGLR